MKNYFWNFVLTSAIACIAGILCFLFGNTAGLMGSSIFGGAFTGIFTAMSYFFGRFMYGESWTKETGIRLLVMLIGGIVFGVLGGWLINVG